MYNTVFRVSGYWTMKYDLVNKAMDSWRFALEQLTSGASLLDHVRNELVKRYHRVDEK